VGFRCKYCDPSFGTTCTGPPSPGLNTFARVCSPSGENIPVFNYQWQPQIFGDDPSRVWSAVILSFVTGMFIIQIFQVVVQAKSFMGK